MLKTYFYAGDERVSNSLCGILFDCELTVKFTTVCKIMKKLKIKITKIIINFSIIRIPTF